MVFHRRDAENAENVNELFFPKSFFWTKQQDFSLCAPHVSVVKITLQVKAKGMPGRFIFIQKRKNSTL